MQDWRQPGFSPWGTFRPKRNCRWEQKIRLRAGLLLCPPSCSARSNAAERLDARAGSERSLRPASPRAPHSPPHVACGTPGVKHRGNGGTNHTGKCEERGCPLKVSSAPLLDRHPSGAGSSSSKRRVGPSTLRMREDRLSARPPRVGVNTG